MRTKPRRFMFVTPLMKKNQLAGCYWTPQAMGRLQFLVFILTSLLSGLPSPSANHRIRHHHYKSSFDPILRYPRALGKTNSHHGSPDPLSITTMAPDALPTLSAVDKTTIRSYYSTLYASKDANDINVYTEDCDHTVKGSKVLRIAVLLASRPSCETDADDIVHFNHIEQVLPAIYLIADVNKTYNGYSSPLRHILSGWNIEVEASDTMCSSTYGPLEAFRFYCKAGCSCWSFNKRL